MPVGDHRKDRIGPMGQDALDSILLAQTSQISHKYLASDPAFLHTAQRLGDARKKDKKKVLKHLAAEAKRRLEDEPALLQEAQDNFPTHFRRPQLAPSPEPSRPPSPDRLPQLFQDFLAGRNAINADSPELPAPKQLGEDSYGGGFDGGADFDADAQPATIDAIQPASKGTELTQDGEKEPEEADAGTGAAAPARATEAPMRITEFWKALRAHYDPPLEEVLHLLPDMFSRVACCLYLGRRLKEEHDASAIDQVYAAACSNLPVMLHNNDCASLLGTLADCATPARLNALARSYSGKVKTAADEKFGSPGLLSVLRSLMLAPDVRAALWSEITSEDVFARLAEGEFGGRFLQNLITQLEPPPDLLGALRRDFVSLAYLEYGVHVVRQAIMTYGLSFAEHIVPRCVPLWSHRHAHWVIRDLIQTRKTDEDGNEGRALQRPLLFEQIKGNFNSILNGTFGATLLCDYVQSAFQDEQQKEVELVSGLLVKAAIQKGKCQEHHARLLEACLESSPYDTNSRANLQRMAERWPYGLGAYTFGIHKALRQPVIPAPPHLNMFPSAPLERSRSPASSHLPPSGGPPPTSTAAPQDHGDRRDASSRGGAGGMQRQADAPQRTKGGFKIPSGASSTFSSSSDTTHMIRAQYDCYLTVSPSGVLRFDAPDPARLAQALRDVRRVLAGAEQGQTRET